VAGVEAEPSPRHVRFRAPVRRGLAPLDASYPIGNYSLMKKVGAKALWAWVGIILAIAGSALAWVIFVSGLLDAPMKKGEAAYARGDWRESAFQAGLAIKLRPGDEAAKRLLARSTARLGFSDAAQQVYGLLGEGSMQAEDFFLLGSGLARQRQVEPAIAVLEQGRGLDPGHAESLHELARLYAGSGRLGEAADAADRLADQPGWRSRGALIAGLIHQQRSDPAGAASALGRALYADPDLRGGVAPPAAVRRMLGRALLQIGRPGEARRHLDAVLGAGADPEAAWLLGRAFLQERAAGRASGAIAAAGDFGEGDPTRPEPAP
jgi:tetratricopeptide (TPR) repeat protein